MWRLQVYSNNPYKYLHYDCYLDIMGLADQVVCGLLGQEVLEVARPGGVVSRAGAESQEEVLLLGELQEKLLMTEMKCEAASLLLLL